MLVRKVLLGGGAATVLSVGVLIGGLTTGLVGAQTVQPVTTPLQTVSVSGPEVNAPSDGPGGHADPPGANVQSGAPDTQEPQQATSEAKGERPGAEADGPGGHTDPPGAAGSQGGAQN